MTRTTCGRGCKAQARVASCLVACVRVAATEQQAATTVNSQPQNDTKHCLVLCRLLVLVLRAKDSATQVRTVGHGMLQDQTVAFK